MGSFNYKKKYGQNFLKDECVINTIVDYPDIQENDLIIEIGPGNGALTSKLKKYNANIISFEIDLDLKKRLDTLSDERTKFIYEDFLKINLFDIIINYSYNKLYVIANLPYYITTPIIEKIIDSGVKPSMMILMVQKEVGDRFISKPCSKEYGAFTVYLNLFFKISLLMHVNRNSFFPVPNVDSSVIVFEDNNKNYDIPLEQFKRLIYDSFQFKRKNIRNNLKSYDLDEIEKVLRKYNLSLNNRSEQVPLEAFLDIMKKVSNR